MSKRPSSASKPPSERQRVARNRSWIIFRLRGIWSQLGPLELFTAEESEQLRELIDSVLRRHGAEPEGERRQRIREAELKEEQENGP
jgi:uncharacterized protein YdiU (UPF0061 family)